MIWALFHRLWSKAVGTLGYNKQEWLELEQLLLKLIPEESTEVI